MKRKWKYGETFISKISLLLLCYMHNESIFYSAGYSDRNIGFVSQEKNIFIHPNIQFPKALYCAISNNNVTHLFPSAHLGAIVMWKRRKKPTRFANPAAEARLQSWKSALFHPLLDKLAGSLPKVGNTVCSQPWLSGRTENPAKSSTAVAVLPTEFRDRLSGRLNLLSKIALPTAGKLNLTYFCIIISSAPVQGHTLRVSSKKSW